MARGKPVEIRKVRSFFFPLSFELESESRLTEPSSLCASPSLQPQAPDPKNERGKQIALSPWGGMQRRRYSFYPDGCREKMSPFNRNTRGSGWKKRHLQLLVTTIERLSETWCGSRNDRTCLSSYHVTHNNVSYWCSSLKYQLLLSSLATVQHFIQVSLSPFCKLIIVSFCE